MEVRKAIRLSLDLLTPRDRKRLLAAMLAQMATSFLDLVGVLLIGLVGALAVTTVQSQPPPTQVSSLMGYLGLEELSPTALVITLAGTAAAVLLAKSVINAYLSRRVFLFLANRQALVSARLVKELLSRPLMFIQERSSQESSYALIGGASAATSQLLGQLVIAASELALLFVLGVALLVISPWLALGTIAFFALLGVGLQRAMGAWAARAGSSSAALEIASLNTVQEALSVYREITVANRRSFYVDRIQDLRWRAARVAADLQFIGLIPKYLFEAALVIGGFALAGVLFSTQDSVAAVGTLALFLAAGTRITPSILRLQSAALNIRGTAGAAEPTFELADALDHPTDLAEASSDSKLVNKRIREGYPGFVPSVEVRDASLTHPGAVTPALSNVSLSVTPGQSVALVGRSGAGKSTLADILLGVLEPQTGSALLSGQSPPRSIEHWPGGVSYVPQDVVLANDSIRANVALGLPPEAIDDELVWEALERAHLADLLRDQRESLDTRVGERGVRLSGGQRQRLGIARALYTRPRLLVLDEATSALDAETEESISRMLQELEGDVTTVIIAHRLSTIRDVDLVVYLDDGRIRAAGTFDEVVAAVPEFARQADLMGILPRSSDQDQGR